MTEVKAKSMKKPLGHLGSLLEQGYLLEESGLPGRYCAEASEIGLPVGQWPDTLTIFAYGREISLHPVHIEKREGDLLWVVYDSHGDGMINIRVFND